MKKHLIVIGMMLMLLAVGLSGCNEPPENQDTTQLSIALFNVEPSMINKGETANLIWNVTGATTVSIDNNIGDVGLSGTRIVSPIQNTTYVLTASNSNTSKTATTEIIVSDKSEYEDDDDDDLVINIPPTKPTMDGPSEGTKDTDYTYVIQSIDPDNDKIQYIINWGDGETTETEFLPNGTASMQIHSWMSAGKYTISVKASDNQTVSGTTKYTVLIDVHLVDEIGYLIDDDADGTYDSFHNDASGQETDVEKQDDGTYLIDSDSDGEWNYVYDTQLNLLMDYGPPEPSGILGFELPSEQVENGDTFWVTVFIDPLAGKSIGTFILNIEYDDSILEMQTPEHYQPHGSVVFFGDWTDWSYVGDVENGQIMDIQSFNPDGQYSKGNLFKIQFKAIEEGISPLTFTHKEITNHEAENITVTHTDNTIDVV